MARLKNHGPAYWLNPAAAAAFDRMEDGEGFIDLNSAGRTEAEQQGLINRWNKGGAANRPPYLYQPASPARTSRHVMNGGIAFDTSEWRRVVKFCEKYGFKWWGNSDPVHFEYVGGGSGGSSGGTANIAAGQRKTNSVVNRRVDASSSSAIAGEPLQAGTIGNFVGWKHGENVSGNNVWYKGTSGHWFWSGGFEGGANGTGLQDLNPAAPAPVAGNQRKVGANDSVNGRSQPNTSSGVVQSLNPGTVGDFKGFVRGQNVSGNDVWFVGAHSGNYFWSGGFEGGANTANLPDLSPQTPVNPVGSTQRKVGANSVNGRSQPNTSVPVAQSLEPGTVGDFKGYVKGQNVDGNDVWFVGAHSGNYFWSGGFEGGANTNGLSLLTAPITPPTPVKEPYKELKSGFYPGAYKWYDAPLGRQQRDAGSVVTSIAHHHQAGTGFIVNANGNNLLSVTADNIYHYYIGVDGKVYETVNPISRSQATYKNNNWTVSVCFQNTGGAPNWEINDAQIEAAAKLDAFLVSQKSFGAFANKITVDRNGFKGHKEYENNSTECPGPTVMAKLPVIIEKVKGILNPTPVDPKPPVTPTDPVEPPVVTVPEGYTLVKNSQLKAINDTLEGIQIVINNLLGGK